MIVVSRRCAVWFALCTALAVAPLARAAVADEANTIVLKDFHFSPMTLTVPAGTTVTWQNMDDEPHTVVSDQGLFRSDGLDKSDTFTFRFDRPGTYRFICSIHPTMMGTIDVK